MAASPDIGASGRVARQARDGAADEPPAGSGEDDVRVVVTGGAGFIGSHLVDALLARPDTEVVVLDNLYRGQMANLAHHRHNPRLRFRSADIRCRQEIGEALHGAELVYHLAAQANVMGAVRDSQYAFATNVAGTFNVLQAARQAGVRRVIFASSREVYGEVAAMPVREDRPLAAKNSYGASKVAAEAHCRAFATPFGLETAVLRFANVYGPRDIDRVIPIWTRQALRGAPIELFGGKQVVDFVPVSLAAAALLRAADTPIVGLPINVGSGVGTPLRALADRILRSSRSRSALRVLPAREAEVTRFVADTSRLRRLLGLRPPDDPLEELPELLRVDQAVVRHG